MPPRRRRSRGGGGGGGGGERDRGAESRARDAESGGTSFDEALASAVAETARAAERNRRELRAGANGAREDRRSRARLEKELEEDRAQCSAKIEELERESRQGSIECQAALRAVRDRASAAEADATRAETRVVELTDAAAELARALDAEREVEAERDRSARRRSRLASTRFAPSSKRRARVSSGSPMNGTGRGGGGGCARGGARASETPLSTFDSTDEPIALPRYPRAASTIKDPSRYPTVARSAAAASTSPRSLNRRIVVERNARVRRTRSAPPSETPRRGTPRSARSESRSSRTRASAPNRRSRRSPCSPPTCLTRPLPPPLTPTRPRRRADARRSTRRQRTSSGTGKRLASRPRRAVITEDHETLLEMLGEKTETCDSLETSLRLATERLERRDVTDASPCFTTSVSQPRR